MKYHKLFLPVMHAFCHNFSCRIHFGPSSISGIGLEDGENAERFWSRLPYASHTRVMRPEIRRDFISLHANLLCQASFSSLPETLRSKFLKAQKNLEQLSEILMKRSVTETYSDFTLALIKESIDAESNNIDLSKRNLFSIARIILDLESRNGKVRGTKKAQFLARTLAAARQTLNDLIKTFNESFSEDVLDYPKVMAEVRRSHLDDTFGCRVLFWKSLEQLVLTHCDTIDAICNLKKVLAEMEAAIKDCQNVSISQAIKKRCDLIESKLLSLNGVVKLGRELKQKYSSYLKDVEI